MKVQLRRLVLLVLPALLVAARPALAVDPNRSLTQYVHRIWQVPQGLPQASIYSILQDDRGYLWLGTQSGLVMFDGVRFATIDDPALRGAWVQSMAEDRAHVLWVGTNDLGLFRVRDGMVVRDGRLSTGAGRTGVPDAAFRALGENVRTLLVDRAGHVWTTSANGDAIATITNDKIALLDGRDGLATASIDAACQADDGTVWIGGASSLISIWNGAGFARYRLASVPASTTVQSMLRGSDGSIWIGTSDGLVRVKDGREQLLTVKDGLADNSVLALAQSGEGGVWVGTKNGFSRVRPTGIESFGTEDGLSQSTVYALCEDREGSFWVGTKHGLNQFLDGRTIPYTTKEGLPSNDTGPLVQDGKGYVWVGTLDAGLGRYDGSRFTALTTKEGLASDTVRALALDRDGNLWVGTAAGLNRVRDSRVDRTYTTAQGLPGGVLSLFVDRVGVLWIGTTGGTTTLQHGTLVRPPATGGDWTSLRPRAAVAAFTEDNAGHVVAAVKGAGVFTFAAGRWTPLASGGTPIRDVEALHVDRDGGLWLGTVGEGLWLVKRDGAVHFSMRDGLFDDEIYGIVADGSDRLWMACSKGIFSVNRADLLKFAQGAIRSFSSTPYSPTDALRTIECRSGVQPAVWQMRDGRLWFSTIRGVIVIDPNHLERRLPAPPVVVEDVTVNGQRVPPGRIGHLAPGPKNIDFVYTGLSYIVPSRITFRYLLEGFDRDWINAGTRREAIYTNLPPGDFRFRVIACNVDGTCGEVRAPVAFAIAPRVYQRRWFFPALAALVALLVWLAYRLRVARLRAQFAMVLGERNRIARELHDTLIQGFSGITMQLQALVARLPASRERTELQEIIRDAGWCLREARRSLAGLRSVEGAGSGVGETIAQTARQMAEGKDARLKLRIADDLPDVPSPVAYNVVRIAQEAIANALKHSGAFTIEVSVHSTPDGIQLSVKDDGAGFEGDEAAFARLGHYGLVGMRERAEEIGGTLDVVSTPDKGTTVTVTVPVAAPIERVNSR